jgi:hypothetical protein
MHGALSAYGVPGSCCIAGCVGWAWRCGATISATDALTPDSASHERTTPGSTCAFASITSASVIGAAAAARAVVIAS